MKIDMRKKVNNDKNHDIKVILERVHTTQLANIKNMLSKYQYNIIFDNDIIRTSISRLE